MRYFDLQVDLKDGKRGAFMTNDRRHIVVTAGVSGIGHEIARRFHLRGDFVSVCDVQAPCKTDGLFKESAVFFAKADVGNFKSVEHFFARAREKFGPIETLINNAGVAGPKGDIESLGIEDWDNAIQINLSGAFYAVKCVIPEMKARRMGSIININTQSIRTAPPGRSNYIAGKSGLAGLTRAFARELGPYNIRCNEIRPGAVKGPRMDKIIESMALEAGVANKDIEDQILNFISMRSFVDSSDIANMALFLASDEAKHVSGQSIGVCGNLEWE